MKTDAVFQGGGIKAIGFVGAICKLEESGFEWDQIAGTSAGAIIASLLAVGYTGKELKQILLEIDYFKFVKKTKLQSIPLIGKLLELFKYNGIYDGSSIEDWMTELLKAKGKTKFKHIINNNESKLKIIASDITNGRMIIIPDDLPKYGIDPLEFEIAKAVKMSASIPVFFKPVILKYKNEDSYVVDGGIYSNFPIWIFDVKGIPMWPTLGFKLENNKNKHKNTSFVSFVKDLIDAVLNNCDENYLRDEDKVRTILIPTLGVKTTEFNITKEKSLRLFNEGYKSAEKFLENWNFEEYVMQYRNGR